MSLTPPPVQTLVTNIDRLVGWPFEDVGRGKLRDGGLGDRIQSGGNPSTHTETGAQNTIRGEPTHTETGAESEKEFNAESE